MNTAEKNAKYRVWNEKHKLYSKYRDKVEQIIDIVRNDPELLFLVRYDYINVYYLGTAILKYTGTKFLFNRKYLGEFADSVPKTFDSVESWCTHLPTLKAAMDKYNGPKTATKAKGEQREKRFQQDIVRRVNSNPDSQYYILDMEYTVPGCSFGRADLVAVSKTPVNGKHKMALIEFKYGKSAFKTEYNSNKTDGTNPYGSGIVGHAYNMNKLLASELPKGLAIELASASKTCKHFKLPPSDYLPEIESKDIDISDIGTWLLCVGCEDVPATEDSVLRYLGYPRKGRAAKFSVREAVSADFNFAYQITDKEYVDAINEGDFISSIV